MNALKTITTAAKKMRKRHKAMSWKSAIKKAGEAYRKKHKAKKRVGSVKRKRVSPARRSKTVKRIRKLHSAEGRAIRSLGSVASIKSGLRKKLRETLERDLYLHYAAKTKTAKRKISKRVSALKREIKNLA